MRLLATRLKRTRVLEPGPIPYSALPLAGDPDLELALRQDGYEPAQTAYRLVSMPLGLFSETQSMRVGRWPKLSTYEATATALKNGAAFPPVVALPGPVLIDGVHRLYAYWSLGKRTIPTHELIEGGLGDLGSSST